MPGASRFRNWVALALGTIIQMFGYFPYAAAFIPREGEDPGVDPGLLGVGLVVTPFVFVVIGFISKSARAPRMILVAMGLFLAVALSIGLIAPALGAAAGFGVGAALTLRQPDIPDQFRRRLIAVALAVVYTGVLLFVATPAGVLTGAILPMLMVGLADDYGAWRHQRAGNVEPT
jgi:hypothetical protein